MSTGESQPASPSQQQRTLDPQLPLEIRFHAFNPNIAQLTEWNEYNNRVVISRQSSIGLDLFSLDLV